MDMKTYKNYFEKKISYMTNDKIKKREYMITKILFKIEYNYIFFKINI